MSKKCCSYKNLLTFLFAHIEASPTATFYESELKSYGNGSFDELRNKKYLQWVQYDPEKEPYYSSRPGDSGNERFIRKINGKIYAYSTEDSGIPRIELKQEDLNRWVFNIDALVQDIKKVNSISGHVNKIEDRLIYLGDSNTGDRHFGIYLALFADEKQAKTLSGIQNIKQFDHVLVLCPLFELTDQIFVGSLEKQKVFCFPLQRIFKKDSLQIDFSQIKSLEKIEAAFTAPELSATEKRKYSKDYPRKDVIKFVNKTTSARSGIVLVNGRELELQYNLYGLLLALALALKKETDTGWVHYDKIASEKLVRGQNHFHRSMSELSGRLDPLVEDNKIKMLQNMKRKSKYRLSTMPSRIKTPHSRWLSINYGTVKNEVVKERAKRVGEENI